MASLVLSSPEDIVNAVLAQIGYKHRVGSLFDGTDASRMALDIYGQTRDALLREKDFDFSATIVAGTISGTAPFPWLYQFAYPDDCLRVRAVFDPAYSPNFPLPVNWQIGSASGRIIWANIPAISINYTAQIVDPLAWEPMFTESLIDALSEKLAIGLASVDVAKLNQQQPGSELALADMRDG